MCRVYTQRYKKVLGGHEFVTEYVYWGDGPDSGQYYNHYVDGVKIHDPYGFVYRITNYGCSIAEAAHGRDGTPPTPVPDGLPADVLAEINKAGGEVRKEQYV